MTLRLRIKELMLEKSARDGMKITPHSLAQAIGVSHNTIRAYVNDAAIRPDLRILEKLQDYFACSTDELFEREPKLDGIERITFAVNDIENMVRFYNSVFDLQLTHVENTPFYLGRMAGLELLMCPNEIAQVKAEQNRHQFRFVVNDLAQVLADIHAAGGQQLGEIQVEPHMRMCGARDPEGNTMELVEYV